MKRNRCRRRRHHKVERLLKWYDAVEVPDPMVPGFTIVTTPLPTIPATFGPEITLPVEVRLRRINSDDREELKATIVWTFGFPFAGAVPQIEVASQQMQFSIWRDAPLTGTRLCTVIDSGHITEILTAPVTNVTNTLTTTFICVDKNVSGRRHNYFLTAAAGMADGFTVFIGDQGGPPSPITTFIAPIINEVHLDGSVIDENET
ncbi:hypothetical protein [Paenibacillus cremeus]|uniref:Uncharacterized protein n=1 Tax=Paenibacillus cremeus TaxID=2163881 RepID=A0A559K476_9BACL|nr:hypothetical protein [Paenibacillus cremeus]TVY06907.1 hypothetical protein FPZ49_26690 [Paenibacillus cremeus]